MTAPDVQAANSGYLCPMCSAPVPLAPLRAERDALAARVEQLETALREILTNVEDANHPFARLEVAAIARAALAGTAAGEDA